MFWHGKGRATLLKYEYQITSEGDRRRHVPTFPAPTQPVAPRPSPHLGNHYTRSTSGRIRFNQFQFHRPPVRPSVRMAEQEEEGLINSAGEFHQMVFWNSVRGEVVNDPVLTGFAHMVSWEFHAYLITCPSSTYYSSPSCLLGLNKVTMNKPFNRIQYSTLHPLQNLL